MVAVLRRTAERASGNAHSEDPGRLARVAYTYLHVPIVAGIIAVAVGDELLISDPAGALTGIGPAMVLGGPALYVLGVALFRARLTDPWLRHHQPEGATP